MTFEQYAHRRLPDLLRIAQSICGDQLLGEELVQDVLVKLQQAWREVAFPDAYVHRMLVNEFLSWRRKWARVLPFANVGEFLPDGARDYAQTISDRDALVREIARLPERQRVVVTLRYLLDLSDADIADALGCRESTVRVHAARALAALRVSPVDFADIQTLGGC